ncbi:uncharacterized protein LOC141627788 [Silene latifolia]|uniref:uncharacterized protein LOC141627788 n=1 Tax=Silene latifolia TaxID=37657 RepID=UPI003D77CB21
MISFNSCLFDCNLDDIISSECALTWTNKQESGTRVWSKLVRVLVNPLWLSSFPSSFAHIQEAGLSDHPPVIVNIFEDTKVTKRFSFLNCWIEQPDYLKVVADAWYSSKAGSPILCFFEKLKSVKHALSRLHLKNFSNISARVNEAKEKLTYCKNSGTQYFHAKIADRHHQQVIGIIQNKDGISHQGIDNVALAFQDYYQSLLGQEVAVESSATVSVPPGSTLSSEDQDMLINNISYDEIKAVIFGMDYTSSLGVDGFSAGFFKYACDIINQDFCKALVKGYNKNFISPRCLIKVDFRKAFDSLQWSFISDLLKEFGFPQQFIKWIQGCITSTWFSLKLNGRLHDFFPGDSGVRQGDTLSPYIFVLSVEILSSIYFGEVSQTVQEDILAETGFSTVFFPFGYLGLPLGPSRYSISMFDSLILKVQKKVQHWSAKLLTYAGKLQLLNAVLFAKSEGLWSKWHKVYSLKQHTIWDVDSKDYYSSSLDEGLLASLFSGQKLQTNCIYEYLLDIPDHNFWTSTLLHSTITPTHRIISTLAIQGKLLTVDNLKEKGFLLANRCCLCQAAKESSSHMFFHYSSTSAIWTALKQWMGMLHHHQDLIEELKWSYVHGHKSSW